MTCKLIEKVRKTIEKNALFSGVKTICAGVSGGADSVCLLDVLCKLQNVYAYKLTVVHVDHMIRGEEAERDARFVQKLCRERGVDFVLVKKNIPLLCAETGETSEECGRRVRYEAFAKTKCDAVAVAHTLSDSIETSLFNLSRGTGLKGACGIKVKRDNIIRPLLDCTRSQVVEYCTENALDYVTDSTNLTDDYSRNFIRRQIVSRFKEQNPNFEKNYHRFIETAADDNDYIEECAEKLIASSANGKNSYSLGLLVCAHKAVVTRALYKIIESACRETADYKKVRLLYEMVLCAKGEIELTKGLYATVTADQLLIRRNVKKETTNFLTKAVNGLFVTPVGNFEIVCGGAEIKKRSDFKNLIDMGKINAELTMRNRKEGDSFSSPLRKNTKTLKKLFNEMKIEPSKRNEVAILCDGSKIVWIDGIGTDSYYCVREATEKFLYIHKRES